MYVISCIKELEEMVANGETVEDEDGEDVAAESQAKRQKTDA